MSPVPTIMILIGLPGSGKTAYLNHEFPSHRECCFDDFHNESLDNTGNLKSQCTVGLVAIVAYSHAFVGVLDSLQAGSQTVLKPLVVIQDLGPIQGADPRIRGVLGENFLAHPISICLSTIRMDCPVSTRRSLWKSYVSRRTDSAGDFETPRNRSAVLRTPRRFSQSLRPLEPGLSCSRSTPAATVLFCTRATGSWNSRYSSGPKTNRFSGLTSR